MVPALPLTPCAIRTFPDHPQACFPKCEMSGISLNHDMQHPTLRAHTKITIKHLCLRASHGLLVPPKWGP